MNDTPAYAPSWRRSSYSDGAGGNCVEIAPLPSADVIAIRDSKRPSNPVLLVRSAGFSAFVHAVNNESLS